jgi:hypothetical protein
MKWIRWLLIVCLTFFVLESAEAGTYSLNLRYQPSKDLSSLKGKIGSTLAMAPLKDERPETLYIGRHTNFEGDVTYFKSNPFPLEKAISDSLSDVFSRNGIKTIPVPSWDDKPESLKNMETDSVLMIEIKRFWTEGNGSLVGTKVKSGVRLVIHLGVKKEGKIFTRNVEVEKEMTVPRSTAERVETMMNQMLTEIFDSYFSNPY